MNKNELEELADAVYDVVKLIPPGRATSYGALAKAIGRPHHARLVGRLMNGCPEGLPAHRVVNSQGILSGSPAFGHPGRMEECLESEGIVVRNQRIVSWKTVFWDPMKEI